VYYAWVLYFCGFCVGKGLVFWLMGSFFGDLPEIFCKRKHKWFLLGVWRLVYLVGGKIRDSGKMLGVRGLGVFFSCFDCLNLNAAERLQGFCT
jgi:hypothetical protein